MARFLTKISTTRPIGETFDYMADFSNAARWDPTVTQAARTSAGAIGAGATFEVVVGLLGWSVAIPYRLSVFERPNRIVFDGGTATFRSLDEIMFVPVPGGTQVVYDARVDLKGPLGLVDPVWNVLFHRSAVRSAAGLARALG